MCHEFNVTDKKLQEPSIRMVALHHNYVESIWKPVDSFFVANRASYRENLKVDSGKLRSS